LEQITVGLVHIQALLRLLDCSGVVHLWGLLRVLDSAFWKCLFFR
jgi:hypothetical protein